MIVVIDLRRGFALGSGHRFMGVSVVSGGVTMSQILEFLSSVFGLGRGSQSLCGGARRALG